VHGRQEEGRTVVATEVTGGQCVWSASVLGLHNCVLILPLRGPCECGGSGVPRVQWGACAEALGELPLRFRGGS